MRRRSSVKSAVRQVTTTETGRRRSVAAALESITASFLFKAVDAKDWSSTMDELWNVGGFHVSKDQLDEMKRLFYRFDTDGSNEIDGNELSQVLQMLNLDVSEEDVAAIIRRVDKDGDGRVGFNEFVQLMSAAQERKALDAELKTMFCVMAGEPTSLDDHEMPTSPREEARVSVDTLRAYLCRQGDRLSVDEFSELAKEIELDEAGMISFQAFRDLPFWRVDDNVGVMDGVSSRGTASPADSGLLPPVMPH